VKTIRLDDIRAVETADSRWKPIRSTLGIEAFGINAYEALEQGDVVFPDHDETEALAGRQRHEELYVVLTGEARFTVDGEELDATPGTIVFVDDPAARRAAEALAPKTTVLAVGGPVGEPYEQAPWERMFLERYATATA
jgi:uncharacterized cupin superfamily protein